MNDLKAFILGTTGSQRLMGAAAVIALAAVLLYLLAFKPQKKALEAELAENARLSQEISAKATEISGMSGKVLTNLDITEDSRRDLRMQLNELFTKKTSESFMDVGIFKLADESELSNFHAQASEEPALPALITVGEPGRTFRAYRKSMYISFIAGFQQTVDFTQSLFLENHYMAVTRLNAASIDFTKDLKVEMTLELYSEDGP